MNFAKNVAKSISFRLFLYFFWISQFNQSNFIFFFLFKIYWKHCHRKYGKIDPFIDLIIKYRKWKVSWYCNVFSFGTHTYFIADLNYSWPKSFRFIAFVTWSNCFKKKYWKKKMYFSFSQFFVVPQKGFTNVKDFHKTFF